MARLEWDWKFPMQLVITRFIARRTDSQRGKIHAMLRDMAKHTDSTEVNMKLWAKFQPFWPQEEKLIFGKPEFEPKSESQLTVEEESGIISRLQAIGDEYKVEWTDAS